MKIREWGLVSLECGGRSVELQEKEPRMNTNIHECFSKKINGNLMKRIYEKHFNAEAQRRKDAENAVFSYCAFSVIEISAPPRLCASVLKFHIT